MTKVTIGGDRLGSGKKLKQDLHNYYRSTHDLSQTWTSPMTVGALYPFLVIPCMRNDKFEIVLDADTITVPTKGPLFGSFKQQVDVFFCPVRLYQAILHNNPTNIGLKMNQVLLPTYKLSEETTNNTNLLATPVNKSSLWKYLGFSGLGKGGKKTNNTYTIERKLNAVPILAYYDIFKNYYSNKQEDNAYVIGKQAVTEKIAYDEVILTNTINGGSTHLELDNSSNIVLNGNYIITLWGKNLDKFKENVNDNSILEILLTDVNQNEFSVTIGENELEEMIEKGYSNLYTTNYPNVGKCIYGAQGKTEKGTYYNFNLIINVDYKTSEIEVGNGELQDITVDYKLGLIDFPLKNIDDMRMAVLSHHTLGSSFAVENQNIMPYSQNTNDKSQYPLNGLVVKTYQSDIFNNWVNTEWIDGENGIAEITKIATTDGAFKIDQLNLAEKLYNMLNRVAVSGGTYEDWQDAVYDEAPHKHIESPIYLGGMSSEIVFEQIVANTAATTAEGTQPLGDLAGRGRYLKRKGGNISVKCDEAGYIIGIVSITPRIKYTQGNEFYLTEIQTLDDMHKPALDGIGFQNLIGERLAWWDTTQGNDGKITRSTVGKLPAWIEYMTAVDKTYGDFAEEDGKAFMSLNRNYEMDDDGDIKDVTTYIDPTKYNYAFAVSSLDAQNFWTEIHSKIIARRKMSAKQIPNL